MKKNIRSSSIKGFVIVVVLLVIIGVSGQAENVINKSNLENERTDLKVSFQSIFSNKTGKDQRCFLPVNFENEVMSLESFSDVRVSTNESIVGFFSLKSISETKKICSALLKEKNWIEVTSGQEGFSSYVKKGEGYSWVFLSCVSVGEKTAVVLQVAKDE